jgi:exodeoxyribonuclease III
MAFRTKAGAILAHQPDILIVPECEHPDKLIFPEAVQKPVDTVWFGKNQNKGLGIFSYSDFRFKLLPGYNPRFKLVIPISVTSKRFNFTLYAIWAYNPGDPDGTYITQVWKAIKYYDKQLLNKQTLLAGDFNSNTIWDKPRREGNHSTVVSRLEEKGIYSTYHHYFKQEQGKEAHPTLYMYRHKKKSYHIDYCFASKDLIRKLSFVEIGEYESWRQYSDHMPVIAKFAIK